MKLLGFSDSPRPSLSAIFSLFFSVIHRDTEKMFILIVMIYREKIQVVDLKFM